MFSECSLPYVRSFEDKGYDEKNDPDYKPEMTHQVSERCCRWKYSLFFKEKHHIRTPTPTLKRRCRRKKPQMLRMMQSVISRLATQFYSLKLFSWRTTTNCSINKDNHNFKLSRIPPTEPFKRAART